MAYSDAKSLREQGAGVAGVAIVHAGLGALVVLGLAATVVVDREAPRVSTPLINIEVPPPPPKPPEVDKPDRPVTKAPKTPTTPPTTINVPTNTLLPPSGPAIGDTGPILPTFGGNDFGDIELPGGGIIEPTPTPTPTPTFAFDSISATPRGDPSSWITESDYRSSWIRREMTGIASFSVGVGSNGRVTNCAVTRSTGHDALDDATCKLIAKRARFNPAKDRNGDIVAGEYSSSVRWQLPE